MGLPVHMTSSCTSEWAEWLDSVIWLLPPPYLWQNAHTHIFLLKHAAGTSLSYTLFISPLVGQHFANAQVLKYKHPAGHNYQGCLWDFMLSYWWCQKPLKQKGASKNCKWNGHCPFTVSLSQIEAHNKPWKSDSVALVMVLFEAKTDIMVSFDMCINE